MSLHKPASCRNRMGPAVCCSEMGSTTRLLGSVLLGSVRENDACIPTIRPSHECAPSVPLGQGRELAKYYAAPRYVTDRNSELPESLPSAPRYTHML